MRMKLKKCECDPTGNTRDFPLLDIVALWREFIFLTFDLQSKVVFSRVDVPTFMDVYGQEGSQENVISTPYRMDEEAKTSFSSHHANVALRRSELIALLLCDEVQMQFFPI